MSEYTKPIPVPSEDSRPYWEAARKHELKLQKCSDCGAFRLPPSVVCPECTSMSAEWAAVSGRGRIYSFVIFHRAYHPAFKDDIPYAVAVIELEEGPRLLSNVVGCSPDEIRCDMSLEVYFEDITPEITLPKFKLIPK